MKRIAFVLALALALSACVRRAPITKIEDTVASWCLESRSEYAGFRDFCDVTRACKPADQSKAKALHTAAQTFCAGSPPETAANRATVKGIVAQQRAVGFAK